MSRTGASTGRPMRRMTKGPALVCSARQRDGAAWRGLLGLGHDECKRGTMKMASL